MTDNDNRRRIHEPHPAGEHRCRRAHRGLTACGDDDDDDTPAPADTTMTTDSMMTEDTTMDTTMDTTPMTSGG